MSKFIPLLSLASLFLLSACGSGGSSSDDDTNKPPVSYNFSLQAVLTNNCGVETPFSDVELILQDADWQVLSTHQANAQGMIEFTTELKKINYTLVAKAKHESEDEGIEAISYYQASSTVAAKFYASHSGLIDDSSCECQTNDIIVSHSQINELTQAGSSANYISHEKIDGSQTKFIGVTTCRGTAAAWPEHSFTVQGPTNSLENTASSGFGTGLTDMLALSPAAEIQISAKNPELESDQVFNGLRHFSTEVAEKSGRVLIFDNHAYSDITTYAGKAGVTFEEYSNLFGKVKSNSEHLIYSKNYNVALDLHPSTDEADIDLDRLTEIQDDGRYNYSSVSKHEMAIFTFDYRAKNPESQLDMPARWTIYGPIAGQLPIVNGLYGHEGVISSDTGIKGTIVSLIRSYDTNDYEDYVNYYAAGNEYSEEDNAGASFAAERHFYHISIELK
ncbi:hypothetical protein [Thalassotalea sp. ND16A]|uniref:hypothetical protein n=1 Tax=Thalassotalea sp. ND16A TaxID=1535422 RepID=UPI00051A58B3|nr:hypothetical protein [Thalassotalea sp. ND16A]KGJ89223.1 hypothetical protein ND16A_2116 [Thalassotalea sp. ND16A]